MRPNVHPQGALLLRHWRGAEYVALTKPGLTLLSVVTAVGGAYLASFNTLQYMPLLHTMIGTALVGGGAGALNQFAEREYDARMKRTRSRPVAAGRIRPSEALIFGLFLVAAGVSYLLRFASVAAGVLAFLTVAFYLFLYTPLKRRTPFATVVGGVAGALPPLIGWASVQGGVSVRGWSLFFILFFLQTPHFLSLAWTYRQDYERAGYRVLTVLDPSGAVPSRQILVHSLALIPAVLMPTLVGLSGMLYFWGGLALSGAFCWRAVRLFSTRSAREARKLFLTSLAFLPLLFLLMVLDRLLRG
jgi:protoheme IX farnesyltransferase